MPRLSEVVFFSQDWAEAYLPEANESVISITDRGAAPADLNQGWTSVLRIAFNDVDSDADEADTDPGEMSVQQALEIARFVREAANGSHRIVVHCRFGQSRSPAVAKAICEHYRLGFPPKFSAHNRLVYRMVAGALSRQRMA